MQDPLNISVPLAGVETSFPLIPEGDQVLQIVESTDRENYDKTGWEWALTFATTQPITAVDGREVRVGTKLFPQYGLGLQERTDGKAPGMWLQNIAGLIDAVYHTDKTNRPDCSADVRRGIVGKLVIGHVIHDTGKDGVVRNKVGALKKYTA